MAGKNNSNGLEPEFEKETLLNLPPIRESALTRSLNTSAEELMSADFGSQMELDQ